MRRSSRSSSPASRWNALASRPSPHSTSAYCATRPSPSAIAPRQAYTSATNLAWREWHDGNPARTRSLLESTRPGGGDALDFRGFEWFFLDRLGRTPLWSSGTKGTLSPSIALSPDRTWVAVARDRGVGQPGDIVFLDASDGRKTRSIGAESPLLIADRRQSRWRLDRLDEPGPVGGDLGCPRRGGASANSREARTAPRPWPSATMAGCWPGCDRHRAARAPARPSSRSGTSPKSERSGRSRSTPHARQFAFSRDWGRLATTSQTALQVWDAATGKVAWQEETRELFTDFAFSPDGRMMAASTFNGWIGFWDATAGARIGTLAGHRGEIHRIQFSPDGRSLASAGRDRVIRIWDVSDSRLRLELRGHESDIWDVWHSTADGTRLASVSLLDGIVKLWDLRTRTGVGRAYRTAPRRPRDSRRSVLRSARMAASWSPRNAAGALQAWRMEKKTPLFAMDNQVAAGRNWVAIGPGSDVLATLG